MPAPKVLRTLTGRLTLAVSLAAGATALAILAPAAPAARIGSDLPKPTPASGYACAGTCSILQTQLPKANPYPTRSPFRGVVRAWRLRHGTASGSYLARLSVVQRIGPRHWKWLRASSIETIPAAAGTETFRTHLRIRKRQHIAIDLDGNVDPSGIWRSVQRSGAHDVQFFPAPPFGMPTVPTDRVQHFEYLWNASVRRLR